MTYPLSSSTSIFTYRQYHQSVCEVACLKEAQEIENLIYALRIFHIRGNAEEQRLCDEERKNNILMVINAPLEDLPHLTLKKAIFFLLKVGLGNEESFGLPMLALNRIRDLIKYPALLSDDKFQIMILDGFGCFIKNHQRVSESLGALKELLFLMKKVELFSQKKFQGCLFLLYQQFIAHPILPSTFWTPHQAYEFKQGVGKVLNLIDKPTLSWNKFQLLVMVLKQFSLNPKREGAEFMSRYSLKKLMNYLEKYIIYSKTKHSPITVKESFAIIKACLVAKALCDIGIILNENNRNQEYKKTKTHALLKNFARILSFDIARTLKTFLHSDIHSALTPGILNLIAAHYFDNVNDFNYYAGEVDFVDSLHDIVRLIMDSKKLDLLFTLDLFLV